MEVRSVDPWDDALLAEWCDVLRASDEDMWPGLTGFTLPDIPRLSRGLRGTYRRFELLAAGEPGGPVLGVGMMEIPLRDNLHSVEVTVAVHPAHRRRGVGTAVVARLGEVAAAEGRSSLNSIVDVPVALASDHASTSFAARGLRGDAAGEPAAPGGPGRGGTTRRAAPGRGGRPRRGVVPYARLRDVLAPGLRGGSLRAAAADVHRRARG